VAKQEILGWQYLNGQDKKRQAFELRMQQAPRPKADPQLIEEHTMAKGTVVLRPSAVLRQAWAEELYGILGDEAIRRRGLPAIR
jgi:hypothetical protein